MVGPVTVQRPSPLAPDFGSFVNNSGGYGFVMVSFGSYVEAALGKNNHVGHCVRKVKVKSSVEA